MGLVRCGNFRAAWALTACLHVLSAFETQNAGYRGYFGGYFGGCVGDYESTSGLWVGYEDSTHDIPSTLAEITCKASERLASRGRTVKTANPLSGSLSGRIHRRDRCQKRCWCPLVSLGTRCGTILVLAATVAGRRQEICVHGDLAFWISICLSVAANQPRTESLPLWVRLGRSLDSLTFTTHIPTSSSLCQNIVFSSYHSHSLSQSIPIASFASSTALNPLETMSDKISSTAPHSQPMAIPIGPGRRRSGSLSDSSSSSSSSSDSSYSPPLNTPFAHDRLNRPHVAPVSPSTSPILSYFMNQSPKSPTGTFPFRRNFGATVMEGPASNYFPPYSIILKEPSLLIADDESEAPILAKHARRASMASWPVADRPPQPPQPPAQLPDGQQDRAAGLLRRLSLGASALVRVSHPTHVLASPSISDITCVMVIVAPNFHIDQGPTGSYPSKQRR